MKNAVASIEFEKKINKRNITSLILLILCCCCCCCYFRFAFDDVSGSAFHLLLRQHVGSFEQRYDVHWPIVTEVSQRNQFFVRFVCLQTLEFLQSLFYSDATVFDLSHLPPFIDHFHEDHLLIQESPQRERLQIVRVI